MKRIIAATLIAVGLIAAPAAASFYPYRNDAVLRCDHPIKRDDAKRPKLVRFRYNQYGYLEIVYQCRDQFPHPPPPES